MELSDFASTIQLGATLTIAFVAVEYTKQYTCVIAQRVFKFQERISSLIFECAENIDKETIEQLEDIPVNGRSMNGQIEGIKREKEKLEKDILLQKKILEQNVLDKCNSRSCSSISLFLFLFSLFSLFISGFGNTVNVHKFWSLFAVVSIIYVFASWFLGEKPQKKYWIDYSSLLHSISGFVFFIILGILGILFISETHFCNCLISCWDIVVITTVLLPYLNFIAFAFIIKCRSKNIYRDIDSNFSPILDRCKALKKNTDELSTIKRVSITLELEEAPRKNNIDEVKEKQYRSNIKTENKLILHRRTK